MPRKKCLGFKEVAPTIQRIDIREHLEHSQEDALVSIYMRVGTEMSGGNKLRATFLLFSMI